MRNDVFLILAGIESRDLNATALRIKAENVFKGKLSPGEFIRDIESEKKDSDCLYCGNQPYCSIYLALMYYKQGNITVAKKFAEEAILAFCIRGINRNEAIAYWLMGIFFLDENNLPVAEKLLERAKGILNHKVYEHQLESKYSLVDLLKECILHIEEALHEARSSQMPKNQELVNLPAPLVENRTIIPSYITYKNEDDGFIIIPSISIYEAVEAGPNGPVWSEQLEIGKTEFKNTVLLNHYYKVYSTKYGERQVTISPDKKFSWAKVHGHSMNATHPIPINEGDYVLFYQANSSERNGIVIAAKADNSGGSIYMVKRYLIDEKLLISETTEQNTMYNPIPITPEYRILGIVVAIAKPA